MTPEADTPETPDAGRGKLAIVLTGGGARAAYQVGVLRCLARRFPELRFDIVTGVSAGAINAVYLAASSRGLAAAADGLSRLWHDLEVEDVFRTDAWSLGRMMLGWGARLVSGGARLLPQMRGMVDTSPLQGLLSRELAPDGGEAAGIADNLEGGRLQAVALTTLDYATGRTVTWVQGCDIENWERPNRGSAKCRITVDHVMASASLPLLFPAVRLGDAWHGDGGIRLSAPLSPALHLGARRVLALSTRYDRSRAEAAKPATRGYPPPAQILGHLMNAVFLDLLDQDVMRLERLNRVLFQVPAEAREGLAPVEVLVLRPSLDLGRLAADYEIRLPGLFRFLTRGLGTRQTESPDFLSLLMFQPEYLRRLIEIGEADAEARADEIAALVGMS